MNDPKKPLTNPAMKQAMAAMKAENTPQTRNVMINEMMRSTFLVPVQVGFAGVPPKMDKNGKVQVPPNTKVSFALLGTTDKKQYFMAFTDWDELHKWRKNPAQQTMMLHFDEYASLIEKNPQVSGFVINPFGDNLRFEREMVASLKQQKDAFAKVAKEQAEKKKIHPGDKIVIVELTNYPDDLMIPVCEVLEANSQVNEAYLQMMIVNDTQKSYLMVLDAPKDNALFTAVIDAARPYLQQAKMDMNLTIAASPLGQQGIRGSEPFYSRVRGRLYELDEDEED